MPEEKKREKLSGMTGKEKAAYFWQYYAFRIGYVLVLAGVVAVLIIHFVCKTEQITGVLVVNADGDDPVAVSSDYFEPFLEENGIDIRKHQVGVSCTLGVAVDSDDPVSKTNLQTIETMLITQAFDVCFADEDFFRELSATDYIADLRDYLPEEVLMEFAGELVWVETVTGERIAAGIRISPENPWMRQTGWYKTTAVAGLAESMRNDKLAVKLLSEVLEKEGSVRHD